MEPIGKGKKMFPSVGFPGKLPGFRASFGSGVLSSGVYR